MLVGETIKPNVSDKFEIEAKEGLVKISFKNSYIIISNNDQWSSSIFDVIENKCKNIYDLRKINGYIYENLETLKVL